MSDPVDHPAHYNAGRFETIDVVEDAVQHAPGPVVGGLQWQVLRYMNRLWHKGDPLQDARKAHWYLARLIKKLEAP